MRTIKNPLMKKFCDGDGLSDDELKTLTTIVRRALLELEVLGDSHHDLSIKELRYNLHSLEGFRDARKEDKKARSR